VREQRGGQGRQQGVGVRAQLAGESGRGITGASIAVDAGVTA
jgi:hypothetical protein